MLENATVMDSHDLVNRADAAGAADRNDHLTADSSTLLQDHEAEALNHGAPPSMQEPQSARRRPRCCLPLPPHFQPSTRLNPRQPRFSALEHEPPGASAGHGAKLCFVLLHVVIVSLLACVESPLSLSIGKRQLVLPVVFFCLIVVSCYNYWKLCRKGPGFVELSVDSDDVEGGQSLMPITRENLDSTDIEPASTCQQPSTDAHLADESADDRHPPVSSACAPGDNAAAEARRQLEDRFNRRGEDTLDEAADLWQHASAAARRDRRDWLGCRSGLC